MTPKALFFDTWHPFSAREKQMDIKQVPCSHDSKEPHKQSSSIQH
jgi:hypothetical protein